MNSKKRRQLIGFITLILFVLIAAPYVITNKSQKITEAIPLLPPVGTDYAHQEENQIGITEDADNVDINVDNAGEHFDNTSLVSSQSDTENNETLSDMLNQQTNNGYTIQLVALKNKQKIEELVALLRLSNYDVYTQPEIPIEGQITRLMVGNYLTKTQAESVVINLSNLTKLNGMIISK